MRLRQFDQSQRVHGFQSARGITRPVRRPVTSADAARSAPSGASSFTRRFWRVFVYGNSCPWTFLRRMRSA